MFLYLKEDVVRLYDFFLAQPPMMPIYLAATIVLHKSEDVRQVDCDMASVHGILAGIPLNCPPFELLLQKSTDLYLEFPPEKIESDVKDRMKRIQEETRGTVISLSSYTSRFSERSQFPAVLLKFIFLKERSRKIAVAQNFQKTCHVNS